VHELIIIVVVVVVVIIIIIIDHHHVIAQGFWPLHATLFKQLRIP